MGPLLVLVFLPALGGLLALRYGSRWQRGLQPLLTLSGGYLLGLCLVHLLPESFEALDNIAGLVVMGGYIAQMVIERFTEGVEHGHMHRGGEECDTHEHQHREKKSLTATVLLALGLHSLVEGLPLAWNNTLSFTSPLYMGVMLHKLPTAFALVTILHRSHVRRRNIIATVAVYCLATPVGIGIGYLFGEGFVGHPQWMEILSAFITGSFLHIATTVVMEAAPDHRLRPIDLLMVILGSAAAYWTL